MRFARDMWVGVGAAGAVVNAIGLAVCMACHEFWSSVLFAVFFGVYFAVMVRAIVNVARDRDGGDA